MKSVTRRNLALNQRIRAQRDGYEVFVPDFDHEDPDGSMARAEFAYQHVIARAVSTLREELNVQRVEQRRLHVMQTEAEQKSLWRATWSIILGFGIAGALAATVILSLRLR